MISSETLQVLAKRYQTALFPNIVREYLQHLFLNELYKIPESGKLLFKGGTALRILYGSPRFSEDLDFSLSGSGEKNVKSFIETLLIKVLTEIERSGVRVEIGKKSHLTSGGYFAIITCTMPNHPSCTIEMNVSGRTGKNRQAEVDVIASDFIPPYTLLHLSQEHIVEEKIFGALLARKKPRDFYDFYFMMRRRMLSAEQKKRLAATKEMVIAEALKLNFRKELGVFLPADQQAIIRDFPHVLEAEIARQIVVL